MQGRRKLHAGDLKGAAEIFRELSIRLQPGDTVCMQALELLARTLVQSGDMLQAEKSYADLAAVAFGNDLWSFKAREGMIFAALAAGDQAKVKDAWQQLQTQTPAEIQELFRSRMTKLSWLVECSSGQTEAAEKAFDAAMANFREMLMRVNSKEVYDKFLYSGFRVLLRDDSRTVEETLKIAEEMLRIKI